MHVSWRPSDFLLLVGLERMHNLDVMALLLLIGDLRFRALCDFNEFMRGRNSTLSNSCAMTLTTSFLHHRANRSLKTATKLNDVQPKLF